MKNMRINPQHSRLVTVTSQLAVFLFSFLFTHGLIAQDDMVKLYRVDINKFEERWNDKGSGNDRDLAFWHPIGVPNGYYLAGSWGTGDYNNPNGNFVTYAWKTSDEYLKANGGQQLVVPAKGLKQVWTDAGSGADWDGSLYLPECPDGYYPIGLVANRSHSTPNVDAQNCGCFHESIVKNYDPNGLYQRTVLHSWSGEDTKNAFNPLDAFSGNVGDVKILAFGSNPRLIFVPKILQKLSNMSQTFNYVTDLEPSTLVFAGGNTREVINSLPLEYRYHNKVVTLRLAKGGDDNRMLDADGDNLGRNGTKVQTWSFIDNNKNQEWRFISAGNGTYFISLESPVAGRHGFLDADGDAVWENNCRIQLWESHPFDNQKWRVIDDGDGSFHVQSASPLAKNGKSIDYGGHARGVNGQGVKLYDFGANNPNQKWYLHILR